MSWTDGKAACAITIDSRQSEWQGAESWLLALFSWLLINYFRSGFNDAWNVD